MLPFPRLNFSRSNAAALRMERDALASQFGAAIRVGESLHASHKVLLEQAQKDYVSRLYGLFYKSGAHTVIDELRKLVRQKIDLARVFRADRDGDVFFSSPEFRRLFAAGVRDAATKIAGDQTALHRRWLSDWNTSVNQMAEKYLHDKGIVESANA